ncbi:7237_t:CDS:1 [Funneliformis mosseae]|uniref:7237_t:CDS:1 n=1 Tax=Funneliformis mosseae TaxID=27381 RepID=A0A9N9D1M1_FUNMO|nr:7237_t:CDS:1 [Funneliformis mosseae]
MNDSVKSATFKLIQSLADDNENKYGQVIILIDEYDSPLLNVISITKESIKIANDSHGVLKSFFEVIKALQSKVKFLLVTGITMFAHLGLFPGLNNLKDVTLSNELSETNY